MTPSDREPKIVHILPPDIEESSISGRATTVFIDEVFLTFNDHGEPELRIYYKKEKD